jgi:acetyl-CoA carboxylase biotin carboxylase subunit
MFNKVLIANRGEIAMRVIRACRELGIATVAVHSEADADALHVRFADQAICIGPPPPRQSYLNVPAIISAAEISAADAIHPGYGFLSENAEFAEVVENCGLTFIGPSSKAMKLWGDKVRARAAAASYGLPLSPGSGVLSSAEHAVAEAERVGFPIMLKARAGGGGRGMRVVTDKDKLPRAFDSATAEALGAFNSSELFLERFVERPRHIEFQAAADQHGHVWVLGERECSLQRRNQKLVEEAPSPAMTAERRAAMCDRIHRAVLDSGYTSLGTLEFLMDEDGELYFMEMNTRVQVEHPVTEMVTGVDLVVEQIRIAAGEELNHDDVRPWRFRGHAIECRVMAECPDSFVPWPGKITEYHPPGGAGVRVDSGIFGGFTVPAVYDSLLAKVIVTAATREQALARMRRALSEFIIGGIRTNIAFHLRLLDDEEVRDGRMTTRTVERLMQQSK